MFMCSYSRCARKYQKAYRKANWMIRGETVVAEITPYVAAEPALDEGLANCG
jgi:hypothetical protein